MNEQEPSQQPQFSPCQAAPQVPRLVLGSPLHVRYQQTSTNSAGVHPAGQGAGTHDVQQNAEKRGFFSLKKRRLRRVLVAVCDYLI